MDYAEVPSSSEYTTYSQGVNKKYKLTSEQRNLLSKYKDINRENYIMGYLSSFSGFTLSGICILLLFFENTRKYAFYALPIIIITWISYAKYLTIEGNKNANDMDKLLNSLEG